MNLETELRKALEPVMHWYQSDEGPARELMDIVKDVVADLQADRVDALKTRELSECVDWLNSSAFTAYRQRDADTGELRGYVTLVDEDRAERVGIRVGILMPTIQECVGEVRRMRNTRDPKIMSAQAEHTTTARGFGIINFKDAYGAECSLQISSACGSEEQPLGYLWLGVNDADPKIMKADAFRAGMPVPPGPIEGWMPFPIPEDVLLSTRMHLGEAQVRMLMSAMEQWLETRTISPAK